MNRIRLLLVPFLLVVLALSLAACNADETTPENDAQPGEMAMDNSDDLEEMAMDNSDTMEEMANMDMGGGPEGLDTSTERVTDNGLFQVSISSELDPLALNEVHSWTIHVETADGEPVEGAEITVDGGMPEHNHGFPTTPEITEDLGGGDYLLEGVKFSMAGWWELKLAVAAGDQTDDVTFNLVLE